MDRGLWVEKLPRGRGWGHIAQVGAPMAGASRGCGQTTFSSQENVFGEGVQGGPPGGAALKGSGESLAHY